MAAIILMIAGKPLDISCNVNRFLDSFEKTDYDNEGRVKQDYLDWKCSEYIITVKYNASYRWENNPFNAQCKIIVKLDHIKLSDDFQIALKENNNSSHEYSSDYEMTLTNGNQFLVKIVQLNNNLNLRQPQIVKFDIIVIAKGTNIRKTISYDFLIGDSLGDSWVAFDPGTSATTIAFGNNNANIMIAKNKKGELLTPSVLVFEKNDIGNSFYGREAESRISNTTKVIGFRSIKKLLGYKDRNIETGKNGKDLALLLVDKIYNDIKQTTPTITDAKRAIIAIPNNYTATKIKEMLSCVENLGQFKEIRTIYEAEAILFYYLSNKSTLEQQFSCKNTNDKETVLVFDMGGATINTTVAQISKQSNDIHEVNILSKIGYGIGGDSIDYCILKSIFEFEKELGLECVNILGKKKSGAFTVDEYNCIKEALIIFSLKVKLEFIKNKNKTELISANLLQIFLNGAYKASKANKASKDIYIDAESDFYRIFKVKSRFCILGNKYFTELIFKNVSDATNEVLKIAGNPKIDKVILSGRSSTFPLIFDNLNNSFAYSPDVIDLSLNGAAKTAVAEGACWYGIYNSCIELKNLKTSANFGFVKTKSPDKKDLQFVNLIESGVIFDEKEEGKVRYTQKSEAFNDRFNFDGNKVNFYQIMGTDSETIIAENQKHKFSKMETIKLEQESERIGMKVSENDDVNCSVRLVSGKIEKRKSVVADQEIADANEEHYLWIVD